MVRIWIRGLAICLVCLAADPLSASHLVTGNGFGFAVAAPESGMVTKFYAHPYSFVSPNPKEPLSEGIETTNFLSSVGWRGDEGRGTSAEYVRDSHVIRMHGAGGDLLVFMPFGFAHPALVLVRSAAKAGAVLEVKWSHPVSSREDVSRGSLARGPAGTVLHFSGIEESLLLVPLDSVRSHPGCVRVSPIRVARTPAFARK